MSIPRNLSIIADTLNSDGTFASISNTGSTTLSGGTANGVSYLNGSKVLTTGSALTFDGTNFATTGTATAAKLIPTGSSATGNGMYLPAANALGLSTNGTNAVYIDSTQNVGIGTSSPARRLSVVNTASGSPLIEITGSAGAGFELGFGADSNGGFIQQTGAKALQFFVNSSERMRIDSSGNVGIGTSSPTAIYGKTLQIASGTTEGSLSIVGSTGNGFVATVGAVFTVVGRSGMALTLGTNDVERMRIDSAGNLGLGATPSAWDSTYKVLQINSYFGAFGATTSGPVQSFMSSNAYYSSGSWKGGLTGSNAALYEQIGGQHRWYIATSVTANTNFSFTQAMTMDISGNLGIGTTSPNVRTEVSGTEAAVSLRVNTANSGVSASNYSQVQLADNSAVRAYWRNVRDSTGQIQFAYNDNLAFLSDAGGTPTERMRIDSGGNLLVGATSVTNTAKVGSYFNGSTTNGFVANDTAAAASTTYFICSSNGTLIGSIQRVGSTSAVVYNTTSDYRLKTVVGVVTGHGERIDALKPIDYQWKEGNAHARGFLAHEFQEVYANSVTGIKDAVDADGNPIHQGMQAGSTEVIADLVAEIQSLRKRLTALESKEIS